jgi:hypothetical protein
MSFCPNCGTALGAGTAFCSKCGQQVAAAPNPPGQAVQTPVIQVVQQVATANPPKTRVAYILLGLFLGCFGVHNFYAGYAGRGIAQLLITVLTLGWGAVITGPWALIEIIVVNRDSNNVPMN